MKSFKIDLPLLLQALIAFLGIASGFFQLFQVVVKDDAINKYVLVISLACFVAYIIIVRRGNKAPLKGVDDFLMISNLDRKLISVQEEEELEQIVDLARSNYTCPINELDYKKAMWEKNPFTFFVVKDELGNVKANLNLLPLTPLAFNQLKSGQILESELRPEDILSNSDEDRAICRHIYVEGLLSKSEDGGVSDKSALILIAWNFEKIVSTLTSDLSELVVCGIGGSGQGEKLMKNLGFHISNPASNRKDKLDFFLVDFDKLKQNLHSKTIVGVVEWLSSRNE
jgi:hypothetical protein